MSLEGLRVQITHHLIPYVTHMDLSTMLKGKLRERDRRLWNWADLIQIPVCYLMALGTMALSPSHLLPLLHMAENSSS